MTKPIGAIILAAGFSSRFEGSKLLASLNDERTVFQQTCERIAEAFPARLVVTRPELCDVLQAYAPHTEVKRFDDAERGLGATLAYAMQHIGDWEGCVVCLGDMPFILPSTYRLIAEKLTSASIVIPMKDGTAGNPVAFGSRHFAELAALDGDSGGKRIVQRHEDSVLHLPVDDPGILQDIDTQAQLAHYQNSQAKP